MQVVIFKEEIKADFFYHNTRAYSVEQKQQLLLHCFVPS